MDKLVPVTRFLVRQGSNGWFVYDRERKGSALIGTRLAENLTKEQADQTKLRLTAELKKASASENELAAPRRFYSVLP